MSNSPENLDNTHCRMIYRKPSLRPQKNGLPGLFFNILRYQYDTALSNPSAAPGTGNPLVCED